MAVHITGDIHGESERFCEECMPGESSWGKDDILIACGDFGIIWHNASNKVGKAHGERDPRQARKQAVYDSFFRRQPREF